MGGIDIEFVKKVRQSQKFEVAMEPTEVSRVCPDYPLDALSDSHSDDNSDGHSGQDSGEDSDGHSGEDSGEDFDK